MKIFIYILLNIFLTQTQYSDYNISSLDINSDNYKNYICSDYKFSLLYPINWKLIPSTYKDTVFKVGDKGYIFFVNVKKNIINIGSNMSNSDLDKIATECINEGLKAIPNSSLIAKKIIYVNNIKSVFYCMKADHKSPTFSGSKYILSTLIISDQYLYTVCGHTFLWHKSKEFLDIYLKLLSTFVIHKI